jgi:hypothetical protein
MTNADKIQAVINTIEAIMIPATYDNVSRITGILKTLAEIRDDLNKPEEEAGTDG